jgi:hypothetical protein
VADNICLHFSACFIVWTCASTALTALWFQHSQMKPTFHPVTRTMWLRNLSPSLWYRSKKSKPKPFSTFCAHPWAFSEPILSKTCDSPACDNLVGQEEHGHNSFDFGKDHDSIPELADEEDCYAPLLQKILSQFRKTIAGW